MTIPELAAALVTFRDSGDDKKSRASAVVIAGALVKGFEQ